MLTMLNMDLYCTYVILKSIANCELTSMGNSQSSKAVFPQEPHFLMVSYCQTSNVQNAQNVKLSDLLDTFCSNVDVIRYFIIFKNQAWSECHKRQCE